MNASSSSASSIRFRLFPVLLLTATLGLANNAWADAAQDTAHIKYRQTVMDGIGANMGGIGDILKNGLDMPGHIESHARQIAEGARLIGPAFAKAISEGQTDAKAEIWKDAAGFKEAIAELESKANDLESAASSHDGPAIGAAVKALGKSCGGCHKSFRKPKEESYKSK
jgi:cytochrome c556